MRTGRETQSQYENEKRPSSLYHLRKKDSEVSVLLALHIGPTDQVSYICDECVVCFVEIVADERPDWTERLIRKLQEKQASKET